MSNLLTNFRRASAPLQEQSSQIGFRVGQFLSATSSRMMEAAGGPDADPSTLAEAVSSSPDADGVNERQPSSLGESLTPRKGGSAGEREESAPAASVGDGSPNAEGTVSAVRATPEETPTATADEEELAPPGSGDGAAVESSISMHSTASKNSKDSITLFAPAAGSASSSLHGSSSMHSGTVTTTSTHTTSSSMHGTSAHGILPASSNHGNETGALMRSVPYSPSTGSVVSAPSPAAKADGGGLPPPVPTPTTARAAGPSPDRGTTVLPFFAGMGAGGEADNEKLVVCESRALPHLFTRIRDRSTSTQSFNFYARRMMRILAEEGIACFESSRPFITTPTASTFSSVFVDESRVCIVSILRAGDALAEAAQACIPHAPVGKILIQRDEESEDKRPALFYKKFPPKVATMQVLLCDPMLATGGSAKMAVKALIEAGVRESSIVFVTVVVCPEGLATLRAEHPDVTVVTGAVDDCLDERRYIIPGLGDFGDRFFGTVA